MLAVVVIGLVALAVVHGLRDAGRRAGTPSRSQLTSTAKGTKKPLPLTIGLSDCTFVEHGATTENLATGVTMPGRTLVTEIRYPARGGSTSGENVGSHPAAAHGLRWIVFAPGYDTTPDTYKALLDAWVRAGFVVVAPVFPDTNPRAIAAQHGVDTEADIVNQPADVAFVTKQVLAADRGQVAGCPLLKGLLETTSIGLAGQSDGATTVAALVYGSAYRSLADGIPFRAVVSMSGQELYGNGNTYSHEPGDPPLLVTQSDSDTCNPPQNSVLLDLYIHEPDSWFLQMFGVAHLPPYTGTAPAAFDAVVAVSTQFLAAELAGKQPAAGFGSNLKASVAKLTSGAPPTGIPTVQPNPASCFAASRP
jgi:hypothetical protein